MNFPRVSKSADLSPVAENIISGGRINSHHHSDMHEMLRQVSSPVKGHRRLYDDSVDSGNDSERKPEPVRKKSTDRKKPESNPVSRSAVRQPDRKQKNPDVSQPDATHAVIKMTGRARQLPIPPQLTSDEEHDKQEIAVRSPTKSIENRHVDTPVSKPITSKNAKISQAVKTRRHRSSSFDDSDDDKKKKKSPKRMETKSSAERRNPATPSRQATVTQMNHMLVILVIMTTTVMRMRRASLILTKRKRKSNRMCQSVRLNPSNQARK